MRSPSGEPNTAVELLWIPVGAGTRFQRLSLIAYECVLAGWGRRERETLLHAGLKLEFEGRRYTVEVTPAPRGPNPGHEVTGPVGIRGADRLRIFRYQVRLLERDVIPDEEFAVVAPIVLSEDGTVARRVAELTAAVPSYVWGRRRAGHPEMWTSDSCVSWLLSQAGIDAGGIEVPRGCRAPGWKSGIVEALRPGPGTTH